MLVEASVYQTAGDDYDALCTLLTADEAVSLIHRGDVFLHKTLRASILSEIG